MTERAMADFGTQTDFEPQTSLFVPIHRTIELKETTKPIVSKVSLGNSPFKGVLNPEQRKAPSRPSVRNTAEVTLPDKASHSQASAELPSPAKPKRARIVTKLEKEEPTSIDLVSGGTEVVGRVLRHGRNDTKRICRLLPNKPKNLRRQVGHAGNPSKPLGNLRKAVQQL